MFESPRLQLILRECHFFVYFFCRLFLFNPFFLNRCFRKKIIRIYFSIFLQLPLPPLSTTPYTIFYMEKVATAATIRPVLTVLTVLIDLTAFLVSLSIYCRYCRYCHKSLTTTQHSNCYLEKSPALSVNYHSLSKITARLEYTKTMYNNS